MISASGARTCHDACNAACQAGAAGDVDQQQLFATSGTTYSNHTFFITRGELAAEQLPIGEPECTAKGDLAPGPPGATYFDLAPSCVPVQVGTVLKLSVIPRVVAPVGTCDAQHQCSNSVNGRSCALDSDWDPNIGLGVDFENPYPGGEAGNSLGSFSIADLAFKVFIQ